ncbi:uncharacterized protein LOC142796341 isoform X1 [Rhipicephalus microplus]
MRSLRNPILLFVQLVAWFGTLPPRANPARANYSSPVLLAAPIWMNTPLRHLPLSDGGILSIVTWSTTLRATAATQEHIKTTEFSCSFSGHGGAATMRSLRNPILLFVQLVAWFGTLPPRANPARANYSSPVLLAAPIWMNTPLRHLPLSDGGILSIVTWSTTLRATAATQEHIKTTEFSCSFSGHGGAATMRSLRNPILLFVQLVAWFGTLPPRANPARANYSSPVLLAAPIWMNTPLRHLPLSDGGILSIVTWSTTLRATAATQEHIKTTEFSCSFSGHGGAATMRSLRNPILLFVQSLQTSTLPSDWKTGKVVPVHKSAI